MRVDSNLDISFHQPVVKVTQGEIENTGLLENFGLPETRERKLTEKGKSYLTEAYEVRRKKAYSKLNQQIAKIRTLIGPDVNPELLEAERDSLDLIKEEFNEACRAYEELLEETHDKDKAYRWYDVRDREYSECRMRIAEHLHAIERRSQRTKSVKSSSSRKSRTTISTKLSRSSARSQLIEAALKAAKLEVEMKFLEEEAEIRRLQIKRELALANAEEETIKKILHGGNEITQVENHVVEEPASKPVKCGYMKSEGKPIIEHPVIKKEPPRFYHEAAPFVPRATNEPDANCKDQTKEIQETTLRDLVTLQAKQAELSALIVDQQRMSCLPAQEPPVFNGNYFDYPAFISAFDAIISCRVASDKDKLYFLRKYTSGKAHEVVKNFLTLNFEDGYAQARKLLAERFGNPFQVAESYKAKL